MKKIIQHNGSTCVVGLIGTADEITGEFYAMWNHGATGGELTWGHDGYAHFWTTPKKLKRALLSRAIVALMNRDNSLHKGKKGGFLELAESLALNNLKEFKEERCLYIWNSDSLYLNAQQYNDLTGREQRPDYENGDGLFRPIVKDVE
jgi:hypothetical protein